MNAKLKLAFQSAREGYAPDRVVADPVLNANYLAECRRLGLNRSPVELNIALLNARKSSALADAPTTRRTSFPDQDEYSFASEISVRFLQRRDGVTLDQILCDPNLATEFDRLAADVAPGYAPVKYRWAALRLRKRKGLRPEPVSRVISAESVATVLVPQLDVADVPLQQGVYLFLDSQQTLYVGETSNLRKRIRKHLEHSDNRGLARWLWKYGKESLRIEYHVLPSSTKTRERKALEAELIQSRHPAFNVLGTERNA